MIVTLSGLKRSGKDSTALALVEQGWERLAFADAVRDAAFALDPFVAYAYGYTRLSTLVHGYGWEGCKEESRETLQRLGTDLGRMILGSDCWVGIVDRKANALPDGTNIVVTDARFSNELAWARSKGGLSVWVDRPGIEPTDTHASENSIGPDDCHAHITNDGTLADLHEKILNEVSGYEATKNRQGVWEERAQERDMVRWQLSKAESDVARWRTRLDSLG